MLLLGGGSLEIVEWLNDTYKMNIYNDIWTTINAAQYGRTHILDRCGTCNVLHPDTVYYAAKGNQFEVIIWLLNKNIHCCENVCAGAARGDHLELLKIFREKDYPWGDTANEAMKGNKMKVLLWALENAYAEALA